MKIFKATLKFNCLGWYNAVKRPGPSICSSAFDKYWDIDKRKEFDICISDTEPTHAQYYTYRVNSYGEILMEQDGGLFLLDRFRHFLTQIKSKTKYIWVEQ